jgi:hypothetical protein
MAEGYNFKQFKTASLAPGYTMNWEVMKKYCEPVCSFRAQFRSMRTNSKGPAPRE